MNFDSVTSDKVLDSILSKKGDYVRANIPTNADLDTYSKQDIINMKQ